MSIAIRFARERFVGDSRMFGGSYRVFLKQGFLLTKFNGSTMCHKVIKHNPSKQIIAIKKKTRDLTMGCLMNSCHDGAIRICPNDQTKTPYIAGHG